MGLLEYSSNNSGGDWWLKDQHWQALEAKDWNVEWVKDDKDRIFTDKDGVRFLGALATRASKTFEDPEEGIEEWETITGENAKSLGCNCCGPPHTFSWEDGDDHRYFSPHAEYGEW